MQACLGASSFRLVCAALLVCCFLVEATVARAQGHSSRLVVLRAGTDAETPSSLADEVDRALLRALIEEGGFLEAYFSPTPFEDVQLLSGCSGSDSDCLRRVATALSEEWVLVREVSTPKADELEVSLFAQDGVGGAGADNARRAHAIMPRSGDSAAAEQLDRTVREMVRSLYSVRVARATDVAEKPLEAVAPARESSAVLRGVGWSSVVGGSALLSSGVVLGVMSDRAYDDSQDVEIRTADDVDRSTRFLDRSRQRASAANKCFIAGSAFALVGVGLLVWDLVRSSSHQEPAAQESGLAFAAAPIHGGAALQLSGFLDRSP